VLSAGTGALVGHPIQPFAAKLLADAGVDAGEFAARAIDRELIDGADLVLAMTRGHRGAVAQLAPKALPRLFTLREFARLAAVAANDGWKGQSGPSTRLRSLVEAARGQRGIVPASQADDDVPDPYGGPEAVYELAFALIDPAVSELARLIAPHDGD
jgi:protein-tyrosine phosphatase